MKKVLMAIMVSVMMLSGSIASAATVTIGNQYEYQTHGKHHHHYKKHKHKKHKHHHHKKHHLYKHHKKHY